MKSLQRLCATIALASMFALPVLAGEISTGPGGAPPPPPPPSAAMEGEIQIPAASGEAGAVDSTWGVALSLVEGVLGLL